MQERGYHTYMSQQELMNQLKEELGISKNAKANSAYKLFVKAEFEGKTSPRVQDNLSAIYVAFNHQKNDAKRYDISEFDKFLEKLEMYYIEDQNSFIPKEKKHLGEWYKKPLNLIINRISTLENDYADEENNSKALARITNMMAWMGRNMIKEKEGIHRAVNIPDDKENQELVQILKALPSEITTDLKNGGIGLGYNAYWYQKESYVSAYEAKVSYNQSDDISSFVRLDLNAFHEFQDFYKIGIGVSTFGNTEGRFYKREGFYGVNTYIDVLDIFRLTYVRRINHPQETDYLYFGVRNLASLIYWLQR